MPNQEITDLMLHRRSSEEICDAAVRSGMKTLKEIGIQKVNEGVTSPEEILRVIRQRGVI